MDPSTHYFCSWIDVFAVAQNRNTAENLANNQEDVNAFEQIIGVSACTMCYWHPWDSPVPCPAPLGRVWCNCELLHTQLASHSIVLVTSQNAVEEMLTMLDTDSGASSNLILSSVRSLLAKGTCENDWARIHVQIEIGLNPDSLGTFVPAPVGMAQEGNGGEGWLGDGPWVAAQDISVQNGNF